MACLSFETIDPDALYVHLISAKIEQQVLVNLARPRPNLDTSVGDELLVDRELLLGNPQLEFIVVHLFYLPGRQTKTIPDGSEVDHRRPRWSSIAQSASK
nr:hypothetical protein [Rhizobium cauense]